MDETEAAREEDKTEAVQAPEEPEAAAPKKKQPPETQGGYVWGTGRRKTAVARVRIRPGSGKVTVNKRSLEQYFTIGRLRKTAVSPASITKTAKRIDIWANISGGGPTGQAGAMMMGLARSLLKMDSSLEPLLRADGYLTRDARMVERKKYGLRGARKRPQYSKR